MLVTLILLYNNFVFCALQNYIARFGHGSAKLARQAQSKEKTLKKMVDGGLTERVTADRVRLLFGTSLLISDNRYSQ